MKGFKPIPPDGEGVGCCCGLVGLGLLGVLASIALTVSLFI